MIELRLSRRAALIAGAAMLANTAWPATGHEPEYSMHVLKDPSCGCCSAWIATILEDEGFNVTVEESAGTALLRYKRDSGIPQAMNSCHTAKIGNYMIEGHVPVTDILRLLDTRPDAVGLAVPGMPYGSPGMGPETEREAYTVFLLRRDGESEVFSQYDAT